MSGRTYGSATRLGGVADLHRLSIGSGALLFGIDLAVCGTAGDEGGLGYMGGVGEATRAVGLLFMGAVFLGADCFPLPPLTRLTLALICNDARRAGGCS